MPAKAFNPTSSPLVLDDGSVLPGGAHGEVDTDSDRILDAVHTGRLVLTHPATHKRAVTEAASRRAERAAAAAEAAAADDPDGDEDLAGEPAPDPVTVAATPAPDDTQED